MAALNAVVVSRAGATFAPVAASAGGDTIANNDGTKFLYINNGGGGSINVTFAKTVLSDGDAVAGKVVAVPAGTAKLIGPFPTGIYNDPTTQAVAITYSGVTSVTVGVISSTATG